MARVTIVLEDLLNGACKVEVSPRVEELAMKVASGRQVTVAEGYALGAVNKIYNDAKKQRAKQNPSSPIISLSKV